VWQGESLEDSALETRAGEGDSAHGWAVWFWEPGKEVDRQEQGGQGCVGGCHRSSVRNSLGTRRETRKVYRLFGSLRMYVEGRAAGKGHTPKQPVGKAPDLYEERTRLGESGDFGRTSNEEMTVESSGPSGHTPGGMVTGKRGSGRRLNCRDPPVTRKGVR